MGQHVYQPVERRAWSLSLPSLCVAVLARALDAREPASLPAHAADAASAAQVTPVVNIVSDFSEGIRLIKLLDNILEVRLRRLPPSPALTRSDASSVCLPWACVPLRRR
jgi:hypothetical protein